MVHRQLPPFLLTLALCACHPPASDSDAGDGADSAANDDTAPNEDSDDSGDATEPDSDSTDPQSGARLRVKLSLVDNESTPPSSTARRGGPPHAAMTTTCPDGVTNCTPYKLAYAVGDQLESLKIFINEIRICDTVGGSPDGCLSLYVGPEPPEGLLNTADAAAQLNAALSMTDNSGYIDMMDAASRAKVAQNITLSAADARTYVWGEVRWAKPMRMTATLVDPADNTTPLLHTRPTKVGTCQTNNTTSSPTTPYDCAVTADDADLRLGPTGEATFLGPNPGGFTFQKPLVITADDIAANTEFSLQLEFNPHGLIVGGLSDGISGGGGVPGGGFTDNIAKDAFDAIAGWGPGYCLGNQIGLSSAAQVAPVFYRSSDQVIRETYTARLKSSVGGVNGSGTSYFDLRVELYSLASDPDHGIYGVNIASLPNDTTLDVLRSPLAVKAVQAGTAAGSVTLTDDYGATIVGDLVRKFGADSVGQTTSGTVFCDDRHIMDWDCPTAGAMAAVEFTLTAYGPVE